MYNDNDGARLYAILSDSKLSETAFVCNSRRRTCAHKRPDAFLPARRYASAGLCDSDVSVCPSVCLSVRLSHAGIVPSRAKAGS